MTEERDYFYNSGFCNIIFLSSALNLPTFTSLRIFSSRVLDIRMQLFLTSRVRDGGAQFIIVPGTVTVYIIVVIECCLGVPLLIYD